MEFVRSKFSVHGQLREEYYLTLAVLNQKRWSQQFGNYKFTVIKLLAGKICSLEKAKDEFKSCCKCFETASKAKQPVYHGISSLTNRSLFIISTIQYGLLGILLFSPRKNPLIPTRLVHEKTESDFVEIWFAANSDKYRNTYSRNTTRSFEIKHILTLLLWSLTLIIGSFFLRSHTVARPLGLADAKICWTCLFQAMQLISSGG